MNVARLNENYTLFLRGKVYNQVQAVNITENVEYNRQLNTNSELKSDDDISSLFSFLFDVSIENKEVEEFRFDKQGNLFVKNIIKEIEAVDIYETVDLNKQLNDADELDGTEEISTFFNFLFGLNRSNVQPNVFRVMHNNTILVNEVLENQTL